MYCQADDFRLDYGVYAPCNLLGSASLLALGLGHQINYEIGTTSAYGWKREPSILRDPRFQVDRRLKWHERIIERYLKFWRQVDLPLRQKVGQ